MLELEEHIISVFVPHQESYIWVGPSGVRSLHEKLQIHEIKSPTRMKNMKFQCPTKKITASGLIRRPEAIGKSPKADCQWRVLRAELSHQKRSHGNWSRLIRGAQNARKAGRDRSHCHCRLLILQIKVHQQQILSLDSLTASCVWDAVWLQPLSSVSEWD